MEESFSLRAKDVSELARARRGSRASGSQETAVHDERDNEDLDHNRHRDDHVRDAQTVVLHPHVPNLAASVGTAQSVSQSQRTAARVGRTVS